MNKLHIFTLHWNNIDKLKKLYNTLIPSLKGLDYIWHIKDNGSTDGSVEYIKSILSDNIKCYFINHNRHSFSEGMNILFEKCNAEDEDLILLLNNDIWFEDTSSIHNMINIIDTNNDVGMVGAKLLYPNNTIQHAGVIFVKRYSYLPFHYRYKEIANNIDDQNKEFQAVTAALALTKCKYYKNICTTNKSGRLGLDETFFWCFEDIDACLSIKYKQGKKIMYCGKTKVYHEESVSLKKNPVNKMMMPHNVNIFRKKWNTIYKLED